MDPLNFNCANKFNELCLCVHRVDGGEAIRHKYFQFQIIVKDEFLY